MDLFLLSVGGKRGKYTQTGKLSGYEVEIEHKGLKEYKLVSAKDDDILNNKIHIQKKSGMKNGRK